MGISALEDRMLDISNYRRPVGLVGLGTALPPNAVSQAEAEDFARHMFTGSTGVFERVAKVFPNSGIETRHTVCPVEWYYEPRLWPERMGKFVEGAQTLYADAVEAALKDAGLQAREIDTIVFVCSTGIATPGIEAIQLTALGFRQDVKRVPVFGLGCAGGVSGLSIASRLAEGGGETVLMVALELCSLAFRVDELTKANIVASALFSDGAAAAILSAAPDHRQLATFEYAGEHTWPDTLDVMGWRLDEHGFGVIFSSSIPALAKERVPAAIDRFLDVHDLTRKDIDGYVFHPGGRKVIEALESALEIPAGDLSIEREILRKFGNMSGPTALFVLRAALDKGISGRRLLSALGPGFTLSMMTLVEPGTA